jgi:pilus assembly protein Flp/PilA
VTDARRGAFNPTAPRAPEAESVELKPHAASRRRKAALKTSSFEPGGVVMRNALRVFDQFRKDEAGAALIEYSVLLGIVLAGVVATITLVGTWVSGKWTALNTAL